MPPTSILTASRPDRPQTPLSVWSIPPAPRILLTSASPGPARDNGTARSTKCDSGPYAVPNPRSAITAASPWTAAPPACSSIINSMMAAAPPPPNRRPTTSTVQSAIRLHPTRPGRYPQPRSALICSIPTAVPLTGETRLICSGRSIPLSPRSICIAAATAVRTGS